LDKPDPVITKSIPKFIVAFLIICVGFVARCSKSKAAGQPIDFTTPAQFLVDKETDLVAVVKVRHVQNRWVILEDGDHFPLLLVDCEMKEILSGSKSWPVKTSQAITQYDYSDLIFEPIAPPAIEARRYVLWAFSTPKDDGTALSPWTAHPQGFLLVRGSGDHEFVFWNGKNYALRDIRNALKGAQRLPLDQIVDPVRRLKVAEERMKHGNLGDETAFIQGLMLNLRDPEGQAKKVEKQPVDKGSTDMFAMNAGDEQPHAIWYNSLAMLRDLGLQENHRKAVLAALTPVARSSRPRVRLAAALALVDLGSDAGREALINGYEKESGNVSEDPLDKMTFPGRYPYDESSMTACGYALARLGDHRGLKNSKVEVRLATAEALKDSGDPEVVNSLREVIPSLDQQVEKLRVSGDLSKQREHGDYTNRYPENWIRARMLLARTGDDASLRLLVGAYINDAATYPIERPTLLPMSHGIISSSGLSLAEGIQNSDAKPSQAIDRLHSLLSNDAIWNSPPLKELRDSMEDSMNKESKVRSTPSPDLTQITNQLNDPDPNKRAEALAAAGYHQVESFYPKVLQTAIHGKGVERNAAIYGLGFYHREIPEVALRQLLSVNDPSARFSALELATRTNPGRFAKEAMDIIRVTLKQSATDSSQQTYIPRILCRLARGPIPTPVLDALKDPDSVVRQTIILALQLGGNPGAIPYLQPLLRDPDPATCQAARVALERLGPASQ
jgi:HEAT repeat protein